MQLQAPAMIVRAYVQPWAGQNFNLRGNMIKLLAKEIRRVRALVDVLKGYGDSSDSLYCRNKENEIEFLRKILGLVIKEEGEKP